MENKKLKFSDWWHYYKGYVIAAVLIAMAVGYTIFTTVTKQKVDMFIDCITDNCFNAAQCEQLQSDLTISGVIKDIDGDGYGIAQISSFPTGISGAEDVEAQNVEAAQIRMAIGQSPVIITDKSVIDAYEYFEMFKDITHIAQKLGTDNVVKDKSGNVIAICIDNSNWLNKNGIKTNGLYVTIRIPSADLRMDDMLKAQFENADELVEYIAK